MLLWLLITAMTVAVILAVAWPFFRHDGLPSPTDTSTTASLNVYKDQISEIEADLARGSIGQTEASAARLELSRRILANDVRLRPIAVAAGPPSTQMRLAVAVAIPLIAGSLYVGLGSPNLPGRPHDTKSAASDTGAVTGTKPDAADLGQLINQVEARLRQAPDDGRGWDVIAPVYLRDQRFADAKFAYARAIELQGPSAARLMGFGESAIRMSDGVVTVEARTAFEKVLAIEPARIEPRYWIAVAREQAGDLAQAAADYRALLSTAPSDAPWRAGVALRLAAIAPVAGPTPLSAIQRGPTAEQAAAAASMTPEQRQQMIASMVDGLHARLKTTDTGDAAGWLRLVRAYATMGEEAKARAALSEARLAVAGDLQGLAAIDGLAKEMGYAR